LANQIVDTATSLWSLNRKTKQTSSGWISGNAVCCHHNGESVDTRGRGGIIKNGDESISYSCFNCNFTANYTAGRPLAYKFRKLLSWLGAEESTIKRLVIEAIRVKEYIELTNPQIEIKKDNVVNYTVRPLPESARTLYELAGFYELAEWQNVPKNYHSVVDYLFNRKIDIEKYNFYWGDSHEHKLSHRVIIPFYWQDTIIGWTARAIDSAIKPKYYTQHEPNFVFNINNQKSNWRFVIVCEGVFDAMSIDGVAVLGNECSEQQADIIDSLGREVIVVPDFDMDNKKWPGSKLIDHAMEYGWNVAFPVWSETCKDINEAIVKYGKLFTLKAILDSVETSKLKIQLRKKKYI